MFQPHDILIPMDLSNLNRQALAVALRAVPAQGATLHLVHSVRGLGPALKRRIVSAPDETVIEDAIAADEAAMLAVLEDALTELAEEGVSPMGPVKVDPTVVSTSLADACLELCDEIDVDLIVAGTHGRLGAAWRPTVTERLVQDAPCSVVVVKPEGYPILRDCA